jgi:murein DD-endopeptidase MepM/ murein hydrolase activator NlpD
VEGEVIIPYSPDHGVFYQTLDQFSTSEAVVFSSVVGAKVKAAAKGVVVSIKEDVRTGTTVTLALGNNTNLIYGQLDVADLKEGDVLEAGECIGTVAEPTRYYVVEGPNLYFQVVEGETSIDPTELLKEEQ